ncbi:MAG: oxygen-independent coproporphyrinogen III oxidase, partial [Campylobacter sp.]|nr:oxygen-independent coproporphyrinogen III oxidase [Campylobacter sp.]
NLAYWQGKNYAGFGAFSVGTNGLKRFYSAQNLNEYIKNPLEKRVENLSKFDKKNEAIFLGARSIVGINSQILNQNELEKAKILTKNKKLKFDGKIFYNQNYLLADEIALFITS